MILLLLILINTFEPYDLSALKHSYLILFIKIVSEIHVKK